LETQQNIAGIDGDRSQTGGKDIPDSRVCGKRVQEFCRIVGLLTSTFMTDTSLAILNRDRNLNYGSIFENAVAQELKAIGFDLYYYRSKKRGELDFVVQTKPGDIFPIEVKSGKDYKRHNALSNVLADSAMRISTGIVLGDANVGRDGKVRYLPIYATQLIAADVF
jgi:predicted AAA+ superfamily ATPase